MMIMIIFFLIFLLYIIFLMKKNMKNKNKIFSIEAGFMSMFKTTQNNFSMQFIFLMLIFIMFDLEILFISSIILKMNIIFIIFFLFFILMTLLFEWYLGSLKWLV